jgi:Flp pilus assembly protein TadB
MLQKYYRPANDLDFIALTRSRGSLRHNIIMVCIPIALLAFAGVYVVWRSILAASAVATVLLVASISSNVRFFRKAKRRKDSKTDSQAVEVLDV